MEDMENKERLTKDMENPTKVKITKNFLALNNFKIIYISYI